MLTVHTLPEQDTAVERSLAHLASLQKAEGCWEGEMDWCTMILSQYVIVRHLAGRPCDAMERGPIVHHYETTRRSDGSWGLHPESAGYVFTTTQPGDAPRDDVRACLEIRHAEAHDDIGGS